jgi:hypothetical protein
MSLFNAICELGTMPIRIIGEVVKDVSSIGDFDDSDALVCLFTCGLSSVGKGIGKTIEKSIEKLDE